MLTFLSCFFVFISEGGGRGGVEALSLDHDSLGPAIVIVVVVVVVIGGGRDVA